MPIHSSSKHHFHEDDTDDDSSVSVNSEEPDILALNSVPEKVDEFFGEDIARLYQNSSGKK